MPALISLIKLNARWSPKSACLQARTEEARALFRNPKSTQFIIVTIPTVMAVSESARLAKALNKEEVPVRSLVVNQVRLHLYFQHSRKRTSEHHRRGPILSLLA